jgi:hypothetical protein
MEQIFNSVGQRRKIIKEWSRLMDYVQVFPCIVNIWTEPAFNVPHVRSISKLFYAVDLSVCVASKSLRYTTKKACRSVSERVLSRARLCLPLINLDVHNLVLGAGAAAPEAA